MSVESGCRATGEAMVAARRCRTALDRIDVDHLDADGVDRVIAMLRELRCAVDAVVVRIGVRADELSEDGAGAPARDALLGSGQVRGSTARAEAARAELARRSSLLGRLMGSGRLGPDHLDALVRRLGRLDDEHLGRVDIDRVMTDAPDLPADTFDTVLRRAADDAALPDDEAVDAGTKARADSEFRHWFNHRTGMGHLTGRLDPERYEALVDAIDQHTTTLANDGAHAVDGAEGVDGPRQKNANLAAEALVDLICSSGERHPHLPHVTVVVDHQTLRHGRHDGTVAETSDGHGLSDDAMARLCCDAVLRRVTLDERGVPIDVGRRYRTATDAQWAALRAVHSSCAWPGCGRPLRQCQAHHIHEWQEGGATDLENLVPLCPHHHHLVHEGRWHLELGPDRALRITRPDGRWHTTASPPTRRPPPAIPVDEPPPPLDQRILTIA